MGMESQDYALRFRDVVTAVAQNVVDRMRPEPKLAKVFSVNASAGKCEVLFAGEVYPNTITVKMGSNLIPSVSMEADFGTLGMNAPGDIVRVAGRPGAYYIDSFVSGKATIESRLTVAEQALYEALPVATLASVTSPVRGLIVHDLSTNSFYGYDGTNWQLLGGEKNWSAFPGSAGWVAYGAPYGGPQYRLENNRVFLKGLLKTTTTKVAGNTVASAFSLPAPSANRILTTTINSALGRIDAESNGSMTLQAPASIGIGAWLSLDGVFYDII